ncbi:MAG TPA: GDSL-type esterase/lipase family protein [Ktedonobacterales bacterium]
MAGPGSGASPSRTRRFLTFIGLSALMAVSLVLVDLLVLGLAMPAKALSPHYYMALGDSLSFGYQPNLDFNAGFADDIFNTLHKVNVTNLENLACAGETTSTMIQGGCAARFAHKGFYTGPQLTAAVNFLTAATHRGRVSPVTLEIGANDVLKDWDASTCSPGPTVNQDLATMDANLTQVILPDLIKALTTKTGAVAGDLHLLNYYNPFAIKCPNSPPFVHLINDHLVTDAATFKIPVVDVYTAFGGDAHQTDKLCQRTWMCSSPPDVHPTNAGYAQIASAVEYALGLPGSSVVPGIGAPAPIPAIGAPAGIPGGAPSPTPGASPVVTPTNAPESTPTAARAPRESDFQRATM